MVRFCPRREQLRRSLFLVPLLIMFHQRVAEVVVEVAVNAVNVIGPVLRIVVLDQEGWGLDEIMVRLTGREAAGPLKMDLLLARPIDARQILIRKLLANASDMGAYELHKNLALLGGHCGCSQA